MGEYVEVIDADPASGVFYRPVDLNDPRVLASDGLMPSESNPQFHQQMVYAVAMTTIRHFEQALGRVALWSTRREKTTTRGRETFRDRFVRRLRLYPHALRDRNAFYSPEKKAVLFGYFPVRAGDGGSSPGTLVFTCLSHDIIAHEVTHALLDGVHPRFAEPVNADVLAFHEAFADIVALFQHFSYPGVLADQIARTRGNLAGENLLGQLAQQFGAASGRGRALRDALGGINPATGRWEPHTPDVRALERTGEAHARGGILVAAVFGAFLKVYRARTADLYRIASGGTGVLEGDLHPDLAARLAAEAARTAEQTLRMCIRAIDYCPPVAITFGDYLRAVVTAEADFNPDDPDGFRLAFVESFRQWGIQPRGTRGISVDGLLWPAGDTARDEAGLSADAEGIRSLLAESAPEDQRLRGWDLETDRYQTWVGIDRNSAALWAWLVRGPGRGWARAFGLVLEEEEAPATVFRTANGVALEVHSVRTAVRRTSRGSPTTDLVVEFTQRRRGYLDPARQAEMDALPPGAQEMAKPDFVYRAGCTLLISRGTMAVRRVIRTAGTVADDEELARMRLFLSGGMPPANAFAPALAAMNAREPFAILHAGEED
ncbi:hypothetical protein [Longimicrobium terrae]|uniref:Peptidase M4 n=1 Tax=Longimicrobium terrae TaxID=1639882 RepID=A0A841GZU0_9BACT|nr:hypothetical protein [Longimicrobium terrae]MBB4637071.1 hypothetical protein [Longimicrobium terrae]MBB6071321.1 hypothetical protein [Longimicrobium terrae]NNC31460.1 hypothetical protein [Longimicrobium terrae]